MQFIYKNVFIGKDDKYNYPFNVLYWSFKLFKDIFKWLYAVSLFEENKTLFALCFIAPLLKFVFIGIQSIAAFKAHFRGNTPLIALIVFIVLIESFFELPMNLLCPVNKVYLHTNYYRVYDRKSSCGVNVNLEAVECLVLLGFLLWYFCFGRFHYSAVVLIILVAPLFGFYIGAKVFYCCYEAIPEESKAKGNEEKDKQSQKLPLEVNRNENSGGDYQNVSQLSGRPRVMPYY